MEVIKRLFFVMALVISLCYVADGYGMSTLVSRKVGIPMVRSGEVGIEGAMW